MKDAQPPLRPSQRLRAIAAMGSDVRIDRTFAENLLREIRVLEGNFDGVAEKLQADITARAVGEAHAVLLDAEARLQSALAALKSARWHLGLSVAVGVMALLSILWGL